MSNEIATYISGTGFSLSGTTVSASANEGTSNRTGTVTITQNESNKTATISLSQSGDTISSYGEWTISVSASPTSVSSDGVSTYDRQRIVGADISSAPSNQHEGK